MFRSTAFVLCLLLTSTLALNNHHRILSRHKNLRNPPQKRDVNSLTIDQKLDHFNAADTRTFKQRYFMNDQYWNKPNGPIFIYVGGEVSMSQYDVTSTQFLNYAAENGAVLIALEHRYFGGSQPFDDLSTAHLAYLSVEQALADAANFVTVFKALHQINTDVPVVAFGASYGGNIAAWLRKTYPAIFSTSVASSAPVQVTVDFSQYLVEVSKSLNSITGSSDCADQIHAATVQMETLLKDQTQWAEVAALFNGCGSRLDQVLDTRTFISSIMELWQSAVQYNDQAKIVNYCKIMTKAGSAMNNLASVNKAELDADNNPCLNFFYNSIVDFYSSIIYSDAEGAVGYRQYFYLQCTQIGFFQTTTAVYPQQPFGTLVTPALYQSECQDVFGVNHAPAAAALNTKFGGKNPNYNQVLFSNGALDPWTSLSVINNIGTGVVSVMIAGSGHSADVYMYSGTNDITIAQSKIGSQLKNWVSSFVPVAPPTVALTSEIPVATSSSTPAKEPVLATSSVTVKEPVLATVSTDTPVITSSPVIQDSSAPISTPQTNLKSNSLTLVAPSSSAQNGNSVSFPTQATENASTQPSLNTVGRIQTVGSFANIKTPTAFILIVLVLSLVY